MAKDETYWQEHWRSHSKLDDNDPQKQVARTKYGVAISNGAWLKTCDYIIDQIMPVKTDVFLDICCGNGLLEECLVSKVDKIIGVDFSEKLLNEFVVESSKIIKVCSDVNKFDYSSCKYDHAIMYFAAQHFSEEELCIIIDKISKNIQKGGKIYIGDVPDITRKWEFYSTSENRNYYYSCLKDGVPNIGTWFEKEYFLYMAECLGFDEVIVKDQPEFMNNSSHRYDVLFVK